MYKNLIFDFDGTLADTAPLIIATMQATIKELGLPPRTDKECKSTIGVRLDDVPSVLWPEIDCGVPEYTTTYRRIFDTLKDSIKVVAFPDVKNTLNELYNSGHNMAIATSRGRESLIPLLQDLGISDYFSFLICGEDVVNGKPAPDPVIKILESKGWKADDTLVIGDMEVDILMAKNAGTQVCGVTYGNATREQLESAHPDYLIDNFKDLLNLCKAHSAKGKVHSA